MLTLAHWVVSDLLCENGLRAGFFTGAEGQRRRTQNIVEFHDAPEFRMLFTSDAGGVGLNLQRAASCVINLELPWNPAVLEQRIGRIYRLGQKLPIDVCNLVCEEGIESRIASLIGSGHASFKGLFDGESDTVNFGQASNFLAKVQKLYEPSALEAVASTVRQANGLRDPTASHSANEDGVSQAALVVPAPPSLLFEPSASSSFRDAELPSTGEVRQFFGELQVRRTENGRVVIEAPAESASTLGALFEGMAALLQSLSSPPKETSDPRAAQSPSEFYDPLSSLPNKSAITGRASGSMRKGSRSRRGRRSKFRSPRS